MTLYAPDGLQMIMMERFESLTSAVDCKGDDGSMSLTFKSKEAYDYALKTWSYINEREEDRFLLIANHEGCGPQDQRQPYLITKLTEDSKGLRFLLTARVTSWFDVAGHYSVDFGKALPDAKSRKLKVRGLLDDITDVVSDVGDFIGDGADAVVDTVTDVVDGVGDVIQGDINLSKSISFDVGVGQQGQRTNIYTDSSGRLKLDCVNCYITGSFEASGHLSVENWQLEDLRIEASPRGLAASLELEASITASSSPDSLQYSKELFSAPVPGAGLEIPGIFELGAILSYEVGVSTSFQGSAAVGFGVRATVPDTANAVLDLAGEGESSVTGFSGAVDPIFGVKQLSASVTVAAFSKPKLSFGVELTKIGKAEVALIVKLPEVSATLAATYNEAGVCSQGAGALKTGVNVSSEVKIQVDAQAEASLGDSSKPPWSKSLWAWSQPLGAACFPLDIPGLGSVPTATNIPQLPSGGAIISSAAPEVSAPVPISVPAAVPIVSASNSLYVPSGALPVGTGSPGGPKPPLGTGSMSGTGQLNPPLPPGSGSIPGTGLLQPPFPSSQSPGTGSIPGTRFPQPPFPSSQRPGTGSIPGTGLPNPPSLPTNGPGTDSIPGTGLPKPPSPPTKRPGQGPSTPTRQDTDGLPAQTLLPIDKMTEGGMTPSGNPALPPFPTKKSPAPPSISASDDETSLPGQPTPAKNSTQSVTNKTRISPSEPSLSLTASSLSMKPSKGPSTSNNIMPPTTSKKGEPQVTPSSLSKKKPQMSSSFTKPPTTSPITAR